MEDTHVDVGNLAAWGFLGLALMVGLALVAPVRAEAGKAGVESSGEIVKFVEGVMRPWIGGDFFANRLEDWQLRDGRAELINLIIWVLQAVLSAAGFLNYNSVRVTRTRSSRLSTKRRAKLNLRFA